MSRRQASRTSDAADTMAAGATPSDLRIEMARSIVEYLCRHGMNAGNHLTEQELVDELQVSRTPIRGALSYLAEKGIVEQRRNRGFFLRLSSHEISLDDLELAETADDRLLDSITSDWFEDKVPQSFSEAEFRRRYSLGRMAASRILLKLSDDGVIVRNRGHGWQFESALNTKETCDESYAFRMAVEPAAIRSPTFVLDRGLAAMSRREHETALESSPERVSLDKFAHIDAAFHRMIGISSRNRFFLAAIERQNALRSVVKYASCDEADILESLAQHLEILTTLEMDDRDKAAEMMLNHLLSAQASGHWRPRGDPQ